MVASRPDRIRGPLRDNGGSARGYQAIFIPSTALASPSYEEQQAVFLSIAALEVNVPIAAMRDVGSPCV
jgi:hypothetical protein